eukprot:TRINITY_DN9672_c0_g1_i1.p1 TRINITY_DN9672_c0_g1~~TRINITY_DN9672_c0_g1_i1.p1  ORF type:complete len:789 (+),score=294.33 TRINITY_DN9672_c0_g1_i1:51-2417(+)
MSNVSKLEKELATEEARLKVLTEEKAKTGPAKKEKKVRENKSDDDKFVLTNAEQGKVVTRFPPEASGFMHIGHAKAALTNYLLSVKYEGRMVFRFDDTNPKKEDAAYEKAIVEDTLSLGIAIDKITYTSDRFDEMFALMEKMLKDGTAYVDDTEKEQIREERMEGIASKRRNNSVEENIAMWEKMKSGSGEGLVVRAKMSVDDPNKCLRDPVLYRAVDHPHVRTGDKYKVYPTYDFACPIVDSLDGVTHALRTSEYNDRNPQYHWICDALNLRKPFIEDFSRLNMEFTVMSKRKLTKFVDDKMVDGWNDPRFPTVKGLLRRGLTVEALKKFIIGQGMSRANNFQEWGLLWNLNRNEIDPTENSPCRRYTCVPQEGSVKIAIDGAPAKSSSEKLLHKKNPVLGKKRVWQDTSVLVEEEDMVLVKDGEEFTLMDWGNIIPAKIERSTEGVERVKSATAKLHLEGDFKKTKKLTWLADCPENKVPVELQEFEHLITAVKPDPERNIEEIINKDTKGVTMCWGEEAVSDIKVGDVVQFERRGYFICDAVTPHHKMLLIPEGKAKMNHLSYWARKQRLSGVAVKKADEKKDTKATDERGMSLEEKRAKKKAMKEQSKGEKAPKGKVELDASAFDIRVGKIMEIADHPNADSLFVEKIDVGSGPPRTVVSGLRNYYKSDELNGKLVAVLCNLKPQAMRDVESCGMVLCASPADKSTVKVLDVPAGAKIGERISFKGYSPSPDTREAVDEIHKKKKDALIEPLNTNAEGIACWKDAPFTTSAGPVTSELKSVLVR